MTSSSAYKVLGKFVNFKLMQHGFNQYLLPSNSVLINTNPFYFTGAVLLLSCGRLAEAQGMLFFHLRSNN